MKGAIKTGIEGKDSGGKEGGVKRQEEIINVSKKSIRLEARPLEECVILLRPYNIQCCQGRLHSADVHVLLEHRLHDCFPDTATIITLIIVVTS